MNTRRQSPSPYKMPQAISEIISKKVRRKLRIAQFREMDKARYSKAFSDVLGSKKEGGNCEFGKSAKMRGFALGLQAVFFDSFWGALDTHSSFFSKIS
jgi:hypothetical protein